MAVKSLSYSLVPCCCLISGKLHKSVSVIMRERVAQVHNTLFQPDLQGRPQQDFQSQQQCSCPPGHDCARAPSPGCCGPWRSDDDDAQVILRKPETFLRSILENSMLDSLYLPSNMALLLSFASSLTVTSDLLLN